MAHLTTIFNKDWSVDELNDLAKTKSVSDLLESYKLTSDQTPFNYVEGSSLTEIEKAAFVHECLKTPLYKSEVKWIRSAKTTGNASIGCDNDLRAWYARVGREEFVGYISNTGFLCSNLGGDDKNEWVCVIQAERNEKPYKFKKRFKEDEIEIAKQLFSEMYRAIMLNKVQEAPDLIKRLKKYRLK